MPPTINFDREFDPAIGEAETISPLVRRIVAPNASAFTFRGTNSYLVGHGHVAIIDPGPDDPVHVANLLAAVAGETVTHVLVTHTHKDHSSAAAAIAQETGAIVVGCAPVQAELMSKPDLERAFDVGYKPAIVLADGDAISGPDWTLSALPTPGHAADHLAFALIEEKALFSGDVVMAWSSTIVSPPDGNMAAYLDTLDRLAARTDLVYWPGHGGPVKNPQNFSASLAAHRRGREQAIVAFLASGGASLETITSHIYGKIGADLAWAARQTIIAHIEHLLARGLVTETKPQMFSTVAP